MIFDKMSWDDVMWYDDDVDFVDIDVDYFLFYADQYRTDWMVYLVTTIIITTTTTITIIITSTPSVTTVDAFKRDFYFRIIF